VYWDAAKGKFTDNDANKLLADNTTTVISFLTVPYKRKWQYIFIYLKKIKRTHAYVILSACTLLSLTAVAQNNEQMKPKPQCLGAGAQVIYCRFHLLIILRYCSKG